MKLSELKKGQKAKIISINLEGPKKRRVKDMGVLPDEIVEVEKIAPLGDPIDIVVKKYHLSLRKSEAEQIEVEVIE